MSLVKHNPNAEHFSEIRWADYARDTGDAGLRREIQAHLDAGCDLCRASADRFRAVARMAVNDRKLVIPQQIVDRAKQIADTGPSEHAWTGNLTVIAAQLVQSSPLDSHPAGVRSLGDTAGIVGDRVLFRAADYSVYLKVEPLPGGEAAEIIGEIVNESEHEEILEGIPVQMVSRGQTLSETATNRFGEFLIEYPVRRYTTLRFALKHRGQRIELPLGGLESETVGDRK